MKFEVPSIQDQVFFVSYGGGHAAALAPVVAELGCRSISSKTLALTTAKGYFDRQGLQAMSMADVVDIVPGYQGVRRVGRVLAQGQSQHSAVSREDTEAYLGVGFHAMARSLGLRKAREIYAEGNRQRFRPVDFFRAWFKEQRPSVVVATSAPRSERAALEAARDLGIPSVCVVDLYAPYEIEWCASPGYASKICVLNEAVARRFREHGVPDERVAVTGNPAFDRLARLDINQLRATARKAMGVGEDEWVVSWMSQPESEKHPFDKVVAGDPRLPEHVERYLVEGLRDRPNVKLVFRRHPSEDRPQEFSGPRVCYSDATQSLDELLCASDCVLTTGSTVGLEAGLLYIPVVQSMDSIFSSSLPLADLGLARSVEKHQQFWPAIDEVLIDASRSNSLHVPRLDASSAGAGIADIINQLVN